MEEKKIEEWARKLHDEYCKFKCEDNQIEVNPTCRECKDVISESVCHKGENVLCNKCWNKKMRNIF